jgi:hypothetical protein
MSINNEDGEQKKRSQAIDRKLEEDRCRFRRECKKASSLWTSLIITLYSVCYIVDTMSRHASRTGI